MGHRRLEASALIKKVARLSTGSGAKKSCQKKAGKAPENAKATMEALGEERNQILRTQGLACVRVPTNKKYPRGTFKWITSEPDTTSSHLVWYTDGSVVHMGFEHYTTDRRHRRGCRCRRGGGATSLKGAHLTRRRNVCHRHPPRHVPAGPAHGHRLPWGGADG